MNELFRTQLILTNLFNYDISEIIIKNLMKQNNWYNLDYCNIQIKILYNNHKYLVEWSNTKPPSIFLCIILDHCSVRRHRLFVAPSASRNCVKSDHNGGVHYWVHLTAS